MLPQHTYTIDDILREVGDHDAESKALIQKAYVFAEKAHAGHLRLSGEPHLSHLTTTAYYLAQMGMDARTIAAALLHDTLEDTPTTIAQLEEAFGKDVLFLVEGVTRLGSFAFRGTEGHVEDLRRFFIASAQDIRVILIKLFDRLHNMQTNSFHEPARARRKANETLEIYVPIADRLSMGRLRRELEDLSFPFVDPDAYAQTHALRKDRVAARAEGFVAMTTILQEHLAPRAFDPFCIDIRIKSLWSLHQKLKRKQGDASRIYDIATPRILVPTINDCYVTLGAVHGCYQPVPGEFKDYIAFPKPNGYQSIHTTVQTPDGPVEIQIRTQDMYAHAEFGIALTISRKELSGLPPRDVYDSKLFFSNLT